MVHDVCKFVLKQLIVKAAVRNVLLLSDYTLSDSRIFKLVTY